MVMLLVGLFFRRIVNEGVLLDLFVSIEIDET
jgi:hypothetical protein